MRWRRTDVSAPPFFIGISSGQDTTWQTSGSSTAPRPCSISRRNQDNDAEYVFPQDMLRELMEDNKILALHLRAHEVVEEHEDVATTSLLEPFIDEAERRTWFLFESMQTVAERNH